MTKNTLKYFIDATLFVDVCSLAVIGLCLGFIIPKGKGAYFLGLHRHAWGDIHLYLALFLIVLLILHLWLNWTWIAQSSKRYFGKYWQKFLCCLAGAWMLVLFIAWVAVKT